MAHFAWCLCHQCVELLGHNLAGNKPMGEKKVSIAFSIDDMLAALAGKFVSPYGPGEMERDDFGDSDRGV